MRRWSTVLAVAGLAGLLLSACGRPTGVDGVLVDDWAPVSDPRPFTPPAEACHTAAFAETAYLSSFSPVDCATSHRLETVHVGTFTGGSAERATPPGPGSVELRAAFAECDTRATDYLGDEWRHGRLWLGVALPSTEAWTGGARWFRCDMTELANVEDNGDAVSREASLRGALRAPSPLALGCYAAKLTGVRTIDSMPAADCGKTHNAEFVGVWRAPEIGYPARDRDWVPFYAGCRGLVARYVGVPDDGDLRYRSGVVALPGAPEQWRSGNHGVRCYLWFSDRTLTTSLKAAGPAGLPIKTK